MTQLVEGELASAWALLRLRSSDKEEYEDEAEYFDDYYDVDYEDLSGLFLALTDESTVMTIQQAFDVAIQMYELGRCHEEFKGNMKSLGEFNVT